MGTKTLQTRKVQRKKISYKKLADILLNLQVEFYMLSEENPANQKTITATNITTPNSVLLHFEDDEFSLSLDIIKKGGE